MSKGTRNVGSRARSGRVGGTRAPTMIDVAAAAGVSQTTVSLVLNNAEGARLLDDTRQHVLDAARALGYRLVKRGAPTRAIASATAIGFVVNEMSTDPWAAIAMDGAREAAWEHGLTNSAAVTRGDVEMEQAVLAQMAALPLLGLIYATIHTQRITPPQALSRIPSVLLNCYAADRSLPSFVPSEIAGGHAATWRLVQAGHRRIGFIMGEALMDASRDRMKGYRQALAAADIPFDPELVFPGNWELSAGYEQTFALMNLWHPPTAIFCANDLMAAGSIEALRELGLRVPADISVIGYDNRELAQYTHPPLTTIVLPHFEMGAQAAAYLIEHVGKTVRRAPHVKVECPLVERQSVGPAISGGGGAKPGPGSA